MNITSYTNIDTSQAMCNQTSKSTNAVELEERVLNALQSLAVFSYRKADGTERVAIGTVNPALIPDTKTLKRLEAIKNMAESLVSGIDTQNIDLDEMPVYINHGTFTGLKELLNPKETKPRKASTTSVPYFDLTSGEWRSYKPETLLSLLELQ